MDVFPLKKRSKAKVQVEGQRRLRTFDVRSSKFEFEFPKRPTSNGEGQTNLILLGALCALHAKTFGFSNFEFRNFSRRLELKLGPDIEIAESTIKVVEQVKRNAGCSKENPALSNKNQIKFSIKDAYHEESGC